MVDLISTWASVGKQWQEIWWRRLRSRALHSGVVRRGQLCNSDGESVLGEVSRYQRTQPSLKTTFVPFVLEQYTRNSHLTPWAHMTFGPAAHHHAADVREADGQGLRPTGGPRRRAGASPTLQRPARMRVVECGRGHACLSLVMAGRGHTCCSRPSGPASPVPPGTACPTARRTPPPRAAAVAGCCQQALPPSRRCAGHLRRAALRAGGDGAIHHRRPCPVCTRCHERAAGRDVRSPATDTRPGGAGGLSATAGSRRPRTRTAESSNGTRHSFRCERRRGGRSRKRTWEGLWGLPA